MDFIKRIETIDIIYISIFTLAVSFFGKSLSVLAGGLFMLFSFHLLSKSFNGYAEKRSKVWTFSKMFLRSIVFYGILLILMLNPKLIDIIFFLVGTMTLFFSIVTTAAVYKDI